MKCLIVEDDPALAAQLAQAMRDGGFACDIAHDGTGGEFLGATESYDLAVLDLGLPGLPGIEVLTRWRAGGGSCGSSNGQWRCRGAKSFTGAGEMRMVRPAGWAWASKMACWQPCATVVSTCAACSSTPNRT